MTELFIQYNLPIVSSGAKKCIKIAPQSGVSELRLRMAHQNYDSVWHIKIPPWNGATTREICDYFARDFNNHYDAVERERVGITYFQIF